MNYAGEFVSLSEDDKRKYFSKVISLFDKSTNYELANKIFKELTQIIDFFSSQEELLKFKNYLILMESQEKFSKIIHKSSEWADIQTPQNLVKKVFNLIVLTGIQPGVIIEPTFGDGNFILQASEYFPNAGVIYGVEIQKERKWNFGINSLLLRYAEKPIPELDIFVHTDNIFTHDFTELVSSLEHTPILIIGNPPWITNAELGSLNSSNLPNKSNQMNLVGIEALTGKSNFDIAESIIQKMIDNFSSCEGKVALLCKNTVIRNFTKGLLTSERKIANLQQYQIDAMKEFGKSCNASLFVFDLHGSKNINYCKVYDLNKPEILIKKFGWTENKFVSDIDKYRKVSTYDGNSKYVWRQGVKHDCSRILELSFNKKDELTNKLGDLIDIEQNLLYPLAKGSNLRTFEIQETKRRIIIPHKKLNEDTTYIEFSYPKTWKYLNAKIDYFTKRKSSIYKNKAPFSIFGIGKYAFRPFKIAIGGMYKEPRFALIEPINNLPVMLDDTCYYLGFETYEEALFGCTALNSRISKDLLEAIAFQDSKRPYTKEVLMRITISEILKELTFDEIVSIWKKNKFSKIKNYSEKDFVKVKGML